MVNDFVLKAMNIETAAINLKEMTYAILNGYMERVWADNGAPRLNEVSKMSYYRKLRVQLGAGPK